MKREYHHLQNNNNHAKYNSNSSSSSNGYSNTRSSGGVGSSNSSMMPAASTGNFKMMWEEEDSSNQKQDPGMDDELLAMLGYSVKLSDMPHVAQKIEQLEEVLGSNVYDDDFSQLVSDTVHYNPSHIYSWLNMLSDSVHQPPTPQIIDDSFFSPGESSSMSFGNSFNHHSQVKNSGFIYDDTCLEDCDDLKAIPGKAVFNQSQIESSSSNNNFNTNTNTNMNTNKRLKQSIAPLVTISTAPSLSSAAAAATTMTITRPVVMSDSQETGIRLVHTLMACAESIQQSNLSLAETLVKQIGLLASSQIGAMRKVATYFAEALARRIFGYYPQESLDPSLTGQLQMHFYETCPYLKFAHFTANQAILDAFKGKKRVHVIDFSMNQGMQWPALMQALAVRPGGPPTFRLTGIGPPASDNTDWLQEVGWKLAQLADAIHVEFEYRGFVANSLADLDVSMLDLRSPEVETVAVNSCFELHRLLARPGAVDKVLNVVKEMKPEIFTVAEQEANHNNPVFLNRFNESLHYYSTLFDSLEGSVTDQGRLMSEVYLGRQIFNIVACEGLDRVERHESLTQWQTRFNSSGFKSVHLGSDAFKQASMLLAHFSGGNGYRVEENEGCLMLAWHTRPLIASSAWKVDLTRTQ